ncbi:efflux RND transporter periplasmic adaptor subunit [Elizabethkingia sp. JS20170427COW]|uniref:efflux RND transporter periplasmic adaptor subunit n=1 Tax=Elizabethkingia sp. JS20170427COW TaxID=2583851 RepID=UPI00143DF3E1|nr:efflux RND transporter periplasmic adaptor subunit [Elizabethkingia sp. JS20170427COW]
MTRRNLYALSILLLLGCKKEEAITTPSKEKYCLNENNKKIIEIQTVKKRDIAEQIHLTGNIETNPDQENHYVSLASGVVSATFFSLGDYVQKGQVLAEMQSTELTSLRAELQSIQAQINIAKASLKSKEQMYKDFVSSKLELIEAKNNLKILQSEKNKIENNLKLYGAHHKKNVFLIKAPVSGIITAKNITSGTTVSQEGGSLFTISNLSNVWAMANLYATDIASIYPGMEVDLKTLSYPNETFKGKIDLISQVLEEDAKVLKAKISLNNEQYKLKPGMIADIIALKKSSQQKIAVPTSALVFSQGKNYVLIYKNDCDIQRKAVEIFSKENNTTYISTGLEENDKIITKNPLLIFESISNF